MKQSIAKSPLFRGALVVSMMLALVPQVFAMHISEGYLSPGWCISWGVICIPFVVAGLIAIRRQITEAPKTKILMAMAGAFVFVLSALKIPSATGSCSHPTGTGLSAILFGPLVTVVLGLIVLLFQALLLAHGGLTTLGANTFSMAIAGPLAAFGIYKLCKKLGVPKAVSVFLAAFLGDLITYVVTALQMGIGFPETAGSLGATLVEFLSIFAVTQIPIAICEGLLTVVIVNVLDKYAKENLAQSRAL